jgi:hypothetical protein
MTIEVPLANGRGVALIDEDDAPLVLQHSWSACPSSTTTYAIGAAYGPRRTIRMHRLVMGAPPGLMVDHVNRDGLDNRRANLRFATASGNAANRAPDRGSSSRFKGVSRHRQRWRVQCQVGRTNHYLGLYASEEDAARAYDVFALKVWGDYAALNFPSLAG